MCPCRLIMPGITYLPLRSTTSAEGGTFNCDAGPSHSILPSLIIIAALGRGSRPVPSINVKLRNTLVSPARGAVTRRVITHRLEGGGSVTDCKSCFRPEAGKMSPAPSGLQAVDGLNHLHE